MAKRLSWAARHGHEEIVKVLLEREDVNPNKADTECGRTPLSWAAESGHGGVVMMLLEREDISPHRAETEYGPTPLSWAAKRGHKRIIKMLLEMEDVNLEQGDIECGQTSSLRLLGLGPSVRWRHDSGLTILMPTSRTLMANPHSHR